MGLFIRKEGMKTEDYIRAINEIYESVPTEYRQEAIDSVNEQFNAEAIRSERYRTLREAVYEAIRPALVNYSRDREKTLYDGLNDCVVYLRMEREEQYDREIRQRDAELGVVQDECTASAEEE